MLYREEITSAKVSYLRSLLLPYDVLQRTESHATTFHHQPTVQVRRIANLVCVYACVLHDHVTGGVRYLQKVVHLLEREDKTALDRVGNRPLCVLNKLGTEIKSIPDQQVGDQILFSSRERLNMLSMVEKLNDLMGACERLVQTPVPLNYASLTRKAQGRHCYKL